MRPLSSRAVLLLIMIQAVGCQVQPHNKSDDSRIDRNMPSRDINAVLRDHDDELMAIPGIVGVFVGLLEDGKTPCLKVMAARKTPALERKIPKLLEGYAVIVEETGVIRPLQ